MLRDGRFGMQHRRGRGRRRLRLAGANATVESECDVVMGADPHGKPMVAPGQTAEEPKYEARGADEPRRAFVSPSARVADDIAIPAGCHIGRDAVVERGVKLETRGTDRNRRNDTRRSTNRALRPRAGRDDGDTGRSVARTPPARPPNRGRRARDVTICAHARAQAAVCAAGQRRKPRQRQARKSAAERTGGTMTAMWWWFAAGGALLVLELAKGSRFHWMMGGIAGMAAGCASALTEMSLPGQTDAPLRELGDARRHARAGARAHGRP